MGMGRWITNVEAVLEKAHLRSVRGSTPTRFRIDSYGGHGGPGGVVVRGRVLDNTLPTTAAEGEGVGSTVRRSVRSFLTRELAGVPLRVELAGAHLDTVSDEDGYFRVRLPATDDLESPWTAGTVALAGDYRGLTAPHTTPVLARVPAGSAAFGIISDLDDTVIRTGVQRVGQMVLHTLTRSELTRSPFPGAAELYRDLVAGVNPVFYVSSSPWNLHTFLTAFLEHHGFPRGPLLLRDLLGTAAGREQKHGRIREILDLHPGLRFVLIGDSGEKDPEIYADIVRTHPDQVIAVYIREVRLDPDDGRVEDVVSTWARDVPFVLAADSQVVRRHAQSLGLL
jgi:phosphatidate phosphatase APP1